jgi:hypothetical protein
MSARKRTLLRVIVWAGALLLALIAVETAYAQEPTPDTVVPNDLNEVAARLMPLLVGASLIERTIEFLFNWVERAIVDTSHRLNTVATKLTGVMSSDLREIWQKVSVLTDSLLKRELSGTAPEVGDPDSPNPEDWPLAKLQEQIEQAQKTLKSAEKLVDAALSSPDYVSRKKMAASILSMVFGVLLAIVANLRLFEPLGVEVADSIKGAFDVIDMILAGILMGLGTDWVHQVIGLIIKGKGLLGRAAGGDGTVDPAALQRYTDAVIRAELDARFQQIKNEAQTKIDELARGGDTGNTSPG